MKATQGPPKKVAKKQAKAPKLDEKTKDNEFEKVLTNEQPPDFENDGVASTEDDLAKIKKNATRLLELYRAVQEEQEFLERMTGEIRQIEEGTLPEIMGKCGMKNFTLDNGLIVAITPVIRAGLPAAGTIEKATGPEKDALVHRLAAGLSYIKENGGEDIIKSEVEITFGKGEVKKKQALMDQLLKKGFHAISSEGVHPQTLNAWVREKLEKGADLPFDTFAIFRGDKAVVKLPKAKKAKG